MCPRRTGRCSQRCCCKDSRHLKHMGENLPMPRFRGEGTGSSSQQVLQIGAPGLSSWIIAADLASISY